MNWTNHETDPLDHLHDEVKPAPAQPTVIFMNGLTVSGLAAASEERARKASIALSNAERRRYRALKNLKHSTRRSRQRCRRELYNATIALWLRRDDYKRRVAFCDECRKVMAGPFAL